MAGEAVQAVYVYKKGNIRTLKPEKRRERIEKMKRILIKKEDIKQYVFVIKELTAREIKRKYARSSLGIIWSVLNPLLMMIVMSLIFSTMFRHKIENFPIYYLTGTLFWDLFSGATNSSKAHIYFVTNLYVTCQSGIYLYSLCTYADSIQDKTILDYAVGGG